MSWAGEKGVEGPMGVSHKDMSELLSELWQSSHSRFGVRGQEIVMSLYRLIEKDRKEFEEGKK